MTIEKVDGRLRTAIRTRNPVRLFIGERTWSELKPGEYVILENLGPSLQSPMSCSESVEIEASREDTIHHSRSTWYGFGVSRVRSSNDRDELIVGEEINDPKEPWAGKVRFTEPQNSAA